MTPTITTATIQIEGYGHPDFDMKSQGKFILTIGNLKFAGICHFKTAETRGRNMTTLEPETFRAEIVAYRTITEALVE